MNKQAVAILMSTYWGPNGWRSRQPSSADLALAKAAGVMFDPIWVDHADIVKRAIASRQLASRHAVANAFVSSLGTHELDRRSALGSYAVLQHFPDHAWTGSSRPCAICGAWSHEERQREDLSVLNFERLKWGGVRHLDPLYSSFDLEQFAKLERVDPQQVHIDLLRELLLAIACAPAQTTAATLQQSIPRAIGANKSERDVLVGILGLCGVLATPDHPGFRLHFIPDIARELPNRRFVDMPYPACWWTGSNGIESAAVDYWFGHLL